MQSFNKVFTFMIERIFLSDTCLLFYSWIKEQVLDLIVFLFFKAMSEWVIALQHQLSNFLATCI